MQQPSTSPDRGSFQLENYIKRCLEDGEGPSESMLAIYSSESQRDQENLLNPVWQKDNLEYELRTTLWIVEKVRKNPIYAQHLYAALCNMTWWKGEVQWYCSWRYAGGVVAHLCGKGDYIDWYCSGISGDMERPTTTEWISMSAEQEQTFYEVINSVGEGTVTLEVRADLGLLGWIPKEWNDE